MSHLGTPAKKKLLRLWLTVLCHSSMQNSKLESELTIQVTISKEGSKEA